MNKNLLIIRLTAYMLFFTTFTNAQIVKNILLNATEVSLNEVVAFGTPQIKAQSFKIYKIDVSSLKYQLEGTSRIDLPSSGFVSNISLPHPDGTYHEYMSEENNTMDAALAANFPTIKSYDGHSIDNVTTVKWDVTPHGLHAMIMSPGESTIFIDPIIKGNSEYYIVYDRENFITEKLMDCAVLDETNGKGDPTPQTEKIFGTCELRTYRLALAATGEYTQFHGGTVAGALAAQVTSMNRVNGVYEREMAIRMTIIANNNLIIYTNGTTDPYTNNNGSTMLNENQTNINTVIGSANYDIGHVFSTGGGGIAQLQSPCTTGKARGVTGSGSPVGDPFDIDYVAHEMGHQFGGNHTFNSSNSGSCSGNANAGTSYEPGSGSTIMAYAGICSPVNVQNNSDDYFHTASLQEIGNFITSAGHTCPVKTPLSNNSPTVAPLTSISIPQGTPFFLTASATDPNGSNVLTYCWEEMDAGTSTTAPTATQTSRANFRTFDPSTNPTRYFPNLASLAANGPFTWEVLPTVARTMNFRVTVRDNAAGGGCNDSQNMTVGIIATAGPFTVTYPNATGISWAGASSQTVTWNVGGTTASPVSCANVDILLSTDGGLTYPTVLATNVPNDGSQVINVPNTPSTTCRIMVRCNGGYFFDISNNNFTITLATFDYTLTTTPSTVSVCQPSNAVYTVNVGSIGGYNSPVTLSVSGVPAGATSNFSVSPVTPVGTSTLTISNTGSAAPGTYTLTITANGSTGTKTNTVTLNISAGSPSAVTQISPANGATGVPVPVSFTWNTAAGSGITYSIDVATDAAFTSIVGQATGLVSAAYSSTTLNANTQYYWRVRAVSGCGSSAWSSAYNFTTDGCMSIVATNVPVAISASGTPVVTSTINIPSNGTITDVNILNLAGTHTYISDLTFTLTSPTGTVVNLFSGICTNNQNFNLNFDDAAASATIPCPPTAGGTYQPSGSLASFNGQNSAGNWILTVSDAFNVDGGSLNSWTLQLCVNPIVSCIDPVVPAINGSSAVCALSSNSYSITSVPDATTYVWTVPSGSTVTSGQGTIAAVVTFGSTSGNVVVTATNACGVSASSTLPVTLSPVPATPGIISGTTSLCSGATSNTYSIASVANATSYTWTVPAGATITSGQGSTSVVVTFGSTSGNVSVVATNTCGTSSASVLSVTVLTTPAVPAAITGSATFCANSTGNTYSIAAVSGASTYNWSVPSGATITSGQGTTSITVTFGTLSGSISVTASNSCGTSTARTIAVSLTANVTPSISIVASPSNTICAGTSVTFTATAVNGGTLPVYQWKVNGTNVGTNSTTYTTTALANNAVVTCLLTSNAQCASPASILSNSITMTVNAIPTAPIVTVSNNCGNSVLSTTSPGTLLWSTGASTSSITVTTAGTYTVTATSGGCTSAAGSGIAAPLVVANVVTLTSPANGATAVAIPTNFTWSTGGATATYTIEIATDAGFTSIIDQATGLSTTSYTSNILSASTIYYWRVSSTTSCGTSAYSAVFSFTTTSCLLYSATDVPINISASGTLTITSIINVPSGGTITDVNVINLIGTHTRVKNLAFTLTSPTGTVVSLMSAVCTNASANFNIDFDDAAASATIPCPPTDGNAYQPASVLSAFNGQNSVGNWTLTVTDMNNLNGGVLQGWSLQLCTTPACTSPATPGAITGTSSLCSGATSNTYSIAAVSGATSYTWTVPSGATITSGQGTTSIVVSFGSTSGNIAVTASNTCGTSVASASAITVNAIPTAPVVTVVDNCGNSVLSTNATGSLLWSTGQTTSSIIVGTSGSYTVTQTTNGCTSAVGTGIANPGAGPSVPVVTVVNNCGTSILTTTATGTLLWSTGQSTSSITVSSGGVYTVTQTVVGCTSAPGSGTAAPISIPAAPVVTVVNNCGNSILSTAVTGTLLWSTGASTPSITVTSANTYTVTTTVSGCTSVPGSAVTAPIVIPSSPSVTVANNCGNSVLSTVASGTLLWSTGASTPSITVTSGNTYTVTTTVSGCTSAPGSAVAAPLAVPSTPTVTVVNNCGNSVLSTTAPGTLLWSTGASTPSITVTSGGTYTVSQASGSCTSLLGSGFAAPVAIPSAPIVTVVNNCGNSVLSTTAPGTLLWSTGTATPSITVTSANTYTVATTVSGCTSANGSGIANPTAVPATPVVNVVDNCGNSVLSTSATGSLLWSTGETTSSIIVGISGSYTVNQSFSGCTSLPGTGVANPGVGPAIPVVSVINNCGTSVLSTTATGSLLWSTGETTSSITVSTGGTYSVAQTVAGCTSAPGSGVAAPNSTPSAPVVVVVDNCGSSILSTSSTGNLLWSTGETTSSITVSNGNTYTVTTTVSGCTSATGSGTAAPLTLPATPTLSVVNNCGNSVLNTTASGTLLWSTGETTPSITVTSGGTYSVTQTASGCASLAGSIVAAPTNAVTPVVTVSNNCGNSVLSSNATGSVLWSNGSTSPSITVSIAGAYTVIQTINGCVSITGSAVANPTTIPSAPVISVLNKCGITELSTTTSGALMWSTSEISSLITVTAAGTYFVSQTVNGCTSPVGTALASPLTVPSVTFAPIADVCINSAPFAMTGGSPAGGTYSGTGVSANQFDPSVSGFGVFTITYLYADPNGCSASNQQQITVGCAEVDEIVQNSVSIYPNPSNGLILVTTTGEFASKIVIHDGAGRLVNIIENTLNSNEISIDLSPYAEGVYSLEITASKSITRHRVVLMK